MTGNEISLDPQELLNEATERSGGLTDLGDGPFLEPLHLFADSLEREARLNAVGRMIAKERILGHSVNRLLYVNDRKRFPEIAKQEIVRPVFIIGLPRTGTTILHDILAQDPANRAPMTWEVTFPSPPPETATFETDPRIDTCEAMFPDIDARQPGFKAIHPMGARLSQECIVMWGEAMCTPLFHNQFNVPSYQDWVDQDADFRPVYDFHRKQLQHLQSRHAGERWVLKTGGHMWALDKMLATYPDARIVFTHRDPVDSVTSFASLTTIVRGVGSDHVDPAEIARDWTARLQSIVMRALEVRAAQKFPDAKFYDMRFSNFVVDQFAVVKEIYEALEIPMTDEGAARMRAFIDANPKGKHGEHRYTPEDYGVEPDAVRRDFRDYIERFELLAS
jgi:hypothetical protein